MAEQTEGIKFTPESLTQTFKTYRKDLIVQPMFAMGELLQHCSIATGIRYREIWSEMTGKFQLGNYKKDKKGKGGVDIKARVFETFFGNCIEPIDPNKIYQSIWGSNVTKGEGLKNVPIVLQVCAYMMKQLGENLFLNAFTAKHNGEKFDETADFFNGFRTIIDNDIAGTNEIKQVLIAEDLKNLKYGTEDITADNAVDIIEDFYWNGTSEKLKKNPALQYFMSTEHYHNYCKDYRQSFGALPYNQKFTKTTLDGATNVELVPLANVPKDFMLITPKSNIYLLFNQKGDDEKFLVERSLENHYDVDFLANMFFGTQFESVSSEVLAVWEKKQAAGAGA